MDKPTIAQISFFKQNWFRMTRCEVLDEELSKLKTKSDFSRAISKLNEIRQRWQAELRAKMSEAQEDARIGIAMRGARRVLTEDEKKEVLGQ